MHRFFRRALFPALLAGTTPAFANSDPFTGSLAEPESAGIGLASRVERSPYRGEGTRGDLLPVYLYEGKRFYLHAYRLGMKLDVAPGQRFDGFLSHRFEGHDSQDLPAALAGMGRRESGLDLGVSYSHTARWGEVYAEYLRDSGSASRGSEVRVGYNYDWKSGRWGLRPQVMLAWRNARLNNYYYGVSDAEVTATRPAYRAGSGFNSTVGLNASYDLTSNSRLLAGLSLTRWSGEVRHSPIAENRTQITGSVGYMYDLSNQHQPWPQNRPIIVRVLHGASTDCNFIHIVRLSCASTHTKDNTDIQSVEIGRTFVERLNKWPVDVAGFVGLMKHREKGFQPDFWQLNAYLKAYYYGFPWAERVKTRVGFGTGLSYARRVPMPEAVDQARRGRTTSKLLNYLDPSVDVSVGDLLGRKSWKDTYVGLGSSHRSGIFGASQLLGNVNGGSNYLYAYLEWTM